MDADPKNTHVHALSLSLSLSPPSLSNLVFVSEWNQQIFAVHFNNIIAFPVMITDVLLICLQMICPMEERLAIIFYFNQQPLAIRVRSAPSYFSIRSTPVLPQ